jgi:glyoxylase-like metal-dependent hydrolase (beta-lactamase superfamily II)
MSRSAGDWDEVAPGFYRVHVADTNCYLVVTTEGMTLVDAGLPASWKPLTAVLAHLGATPDDIDRLILTHGHFDHVGMAARLHGENEVRTLVHPGDRYLARHPYRYRHERARLPYLWQHPAALPVLGRMTLAGALQVRGVDAEPRIENGGVVDAPGRPVAIWTPGHTDGHCGFFFEEVGVLLTGDAFVTLDPYTGESGPRVVARAATADSTAALTALDAFSDLSAGVLLPGHGEPWAGDIETALDLARRAPIG